MVMECDGGVVSAEQMQVFVPGLQEFKNLKYHHSDGIGAIRFADGVCYVVTYQERLCLDGSPPINVATDVFIISPVKLLRSARFASNFILRLARAKLLQAFELMLRVAP